MVVNHLFQPMQYIFCEERLTLIQNQKKHSCLKGNMQRKILALAFLGFGSLAAWAQGSNWVGTWAYSPVGESVNSGQPGPGNFTYRNIVHISLGGRDVRVQLRPCWAYSDAPAAT